MKYRKYGRTDMKISVIGFGGMRFKKEESIENCAQLVKYAFEKGINYFDTAPGYRRSEDIFGLAFEELKSRRAEFFVSTKTNKSKPSEIRKDIERSLNRMKLDYIDIYYMWCVMNSKDFENRCKHGALEEFEKLKYEGIIKHICVSTHMPGDDIKELLKRYNFEGILLGYSVMNFAFRESAISSAYQFRKGIVVMNPLGGGIIPAHPSLFSFVRTNKNETVVEGALRFLINDRRITCALVGFSSRNEIDEAVEAVNKFKPINQQKIEKIRRGLKESFNNMCTGCRYCDKCPFNIPVPQLMDSYNYYLLKGERSAMIERLKWHWGIEISDILNMKCRECGRCESFCTQHLEIIPRIREIYKVAKEMKKN